MRKQWVGSVLLLLLSGCQAIWGFEPFESIRPGSSGGSTGAGGDGFGGEICAGCASSDDSFCVDKTLCVCDGGEVRGEEICASSELCQFAVDEGDEVCPATGCVKARCDGDPEQLHFYECREDRTGEDETLCGSASQCAPAFGCISIQMDQFEASVQDYLLFAEKEPDRGDTFGDSELFGEEGVCGDTDASALDDECLDAKNGYLNGCKDCFACTAAGTCGSECSKCDQELPMACVTWCQAMAYCRDRGGRLCGGLGAKGALDKPAPFDDLNADANLDTSAWSNACEAAYGSLPQPFSTGKELSPDCVRAAMGPSADRGGNCHSANAGYQGFYNLSGNVAEWEDSCQFPGEKDSLCRVRGGSFQDPEDQSSLRCSVAKTARRNEASLHVGFRCCYPDQENAE